MPTSPLLTSVMAASASATILTASWFTLVVGKWNTCDQKPISFCFHLARNLSSADKLSCRSRKMYRVDHRYSTGSSASSDSGLRFQRKAVDRHDLNKFSTDPR